jgi:hypothetical protein
MIRRAIPLTIFLVERKGEGLQLICQRFGKVFLAKAYNKLIFNKIFDQKLIY